jgi:hypothetical protein
MSDWRLGGGVPPVSTGTRWEEECVTRIMLNLVRRGSDAFLRRGARQFADDLLANAGGFVHCKRRMDVMR